MDIPIPDLEDEDDQKSCYAYDNNSTQWRGNTQNQLERNNNFHSCFSFRSINPFVNNKFPEIPLQYSHQSFPYICPETVIKLMRNEIQLHNFPNGVKVVFIDCRFAYEFNAGHINSAYNLLTFEDLISIFNSERDDDAILIFHCELTIDRSVKWAYIFRNYDRYCSGLHFPQLAYPNLYLLKGGFREFYNCATSSFENNCSSSQGSNFTSNSISSNNVFQSHIVQIESDLPISDVFVGKYLTKDEGFSVYGSDVVKESQSLFSNQIQIATQFLSHKSH